MEASGHFRGHGDFVGNGSIHLQRSSIPEFIVSFLGRLRKNNFLLDSIDLPTCSRAVTRVNVAPARPRVLFSPLLGALHAPPRK